MQLVHREGGGLTEPNFHEKDGPFSVVKWADRVLKQHRPVVGECFTNTDSYEKIFVIADRGREIGSWDKSVGHQTFCVASTAPPKGGEMRRLAFARPRRRGKKILTPGGAEVIGESTLARASANSHQRPSARTISELEVNQLFGARKWTQRREKSFDRRDCLEEIDSF